MSGAAFPQTSSLASVLIPSDPAQSRYKCWPWSWFWNSQKHKGPALYQIPRLEYAKSASRLTNTCSLGRLWTWKNSKTMSDFPKKASPTSLFLVDMTFSSSQGVILLDCNSHYTGPQFVPWVSEGLKTELWKMVHSVSPLQGREKFCPIVFKTGPGFWEHAPTDRPVTGKFIPHSSHGKTSLRKLRDEPSWFK